MRGTPDEGPSRQSCHACAGDRRAFDELVKRYRARIFALSLHLTGQESDADDVTQEVFLRAYRSLGAFEGRSHVLTWLYRLAVNSALNAQRTRRRRRETVLADPRVERALAVDAAGSPAQLAELRQTYTRLIEALDSLPPAMRTSVVLVALQGLSHADVALVQQCSAGTVAWHLHEARRRLRLALDQQRVAREGRRPGVSSELSDLLCKAGLPTAVER